MAERCRKAEAEVSEESRKGSSERLKEMIRERRGARASGAASREKVAELSKQIQRQVRRELRERKREKIAAILTEFRGLKHIADVRAHGVKRKLGCVVDKSGKLQSGREGVVEAFAEFYADLYSSRKNEGSDMVANLWVGVQEVPKVEVEEVEQQLKKMARRKAADGAGIVAEMLKDGGHTLYELLAEVFSDVLAARQDPPEYWKETRIKVLLKKGDAQCLDNYRPLSIIPILYKVFSRILDSRLRRFLSAEQSVDQAAYKPGFSCEDHLFTLTMLAEKSAEFQLPVWMAAVDFRKAFDSVEFESIWSSLEELNVPAQYTAVLKLLYAGQTARVVDEAESKPFKLGRGTKQGDPVSCVLFNSVVECVMRRLKKRWTSKGWGFDLGEGNPRRLQNLRFADDIILFGTSLLQASRMLDDLRQMCQEVGLSVHYGKTKFLSNLANRSGFFNSLKKVPIDGSDVEVLAVDGSIAYLGRCLCFQNFMDVELDHRIGRGWAKFGVYKGELCDRRYSLVHRIRLFNAVVTPTILYGCGSWTLSVGARRRLRAAQRRMIRKMLGVRRGRRAVAEEGEPDGEGEGSSSVGGSSSSSSTTSVSEGGGQSGETDEEEDGEDDEEQDVEKQKETWVEWMVRTAGLVDGALQRAKVPDWVEEQKRRKWRWAGHVARREDGRWSRRLMDWVPTKGGRRIGRPAVRREDDLNKFGRAIGADWRMLAQDRGSWDAEEDRYVVFTG